MRLSAIMILPSASARDDAVAFLEKHGAFDILSTEGAAGASIAFKICCDDDDAIVDALAVMLYANARSPDAIEARMGDLEAAVASVRQRAV